MDEMEDFTKLKVPDLKKELKIRGLTTVGNKTELLERLQRSIKSKLDDSVSAESVDDQVDDLDDDDLLNDDDSDHDHDSIVPSESVLKELDEQLDVSPPTNGTKRPLENANLEVRPVKKLILNRKLSVTTDLTIEKLKETITPPAAFSTPIAHVSDNESDDKKVIKLNNLSTKERLELRAKKFGAPTSADAKKLARLERFGANASDSSTSTAIVKATGNLDTLKKRAERFGGSVSKAMSSLEQKERLELRKARFGKLSTCM